MQCTCISAKITVVYKSRSKWHVQYFLWKCYPAPAKILCWSNCFICCMAILSILSAIIFFTTKTQSIQSQGMMHGSVLHSNLTSVLTNFKVFDLIFLIICFITILNTILFFYTPSISTIGRWVSCGPWVSCSGVILRAFRKGEVLAQILDFPIHPIHFHFFLSLR